MRVGVNTGAVVVGPVGAGSRVEYGATGDAVNVAARLQSAAEPGAVLAGAETRRLAERQFAWGDRQSLTLKGKAESVQAWAVERRHLARPRGDRHAARRPRAGAGGRARRPSSDVQAGAGSILFVSGEPGIGKSRFLGELRRLAPEPTWLEGRCVSYGESMQYWPFRDLLRDWLGLGLDDPELRARLSLRRALNQLAGESADDYYPYLAALLGLTRGAGVPTRASPSSRPRRCSTAPSRSSATCSRSSPRKARSCSCSRTSTGPTRRRCSWPSSCCR